MKHIKTNGTTLATLCLLLMLFTLLTTAKTVIAIGADDTKPLTKIPLTHEERQWLNDHPKLRVMADTNWPPFNFIEDGEIKGYSNDLIRLIADKLGVEIEFVTGYTWNEYMEMLKNRNIDMISNMKITPDRHHFTLFSERSIVVPVPGLAFRGEQQKKLGLDGLSGRKLAVVRGFFHEELLKHHYPDIELVLTENTLQSLKYVMAGRAYAAIESLPVIAYYIDKHYLTDLEAQPLIDNPIFEASPQHIGIRNDAPILKRTIDKAIASLSDQEIKQLHNLWLPFSRHHTTETRLRLSNEQRRFLNESDGIRYCVDPDWMPFERISEAGQHEGMVADLIAMVGKRLDIPLHMVPTASWTDTLAAIRAGRCQVLSAAAPIASRREYLDFSAPHSQYPLVVAVRNEALFVEDLAAIRDRTLGVVASYAHIDLIRERYPDLKIREMANVKDGLTRVANEELFGFVDIAPSIQYTMRRHRIANLKIGGKLEIDLSLTFAVRKGEPPELLAVIDKALEDITEEERLLLADKWFSIKIEKVSDYSLLWKVLVAVTVIFAFFLIWNHQLSQINRKHLQMILDLDRSKEQFLSIIEADTDWHWEVDTQGHYTYLSARVKDTLGYEAQELIGKTPFELMPPEEAVKIGEAFGSIVSGGRPFRNLLNLNLHKNGEEVMLETSGNPIHDNDGNVIGYRGIDRNVTERFKVQKTLEEAKIEAEKANKAKSEFLANMSHELRTPMNAIIGFSQLIDRDRTLDPEHRDHLAIIRRSGEHLMHLINDVLDMSKIEAGRTIFHENSFDLHGLLDDLKDTMRFRVEKKSLSLVVERSPDVPRFVETDETKLRQVLVNLIGNAIKFTKEGSVIVRARVKEYERKLNAGTIIFEVEDTGPGIASKDLAVLFDPFVQTEAGKQSQEGTGLGMAISRKFVQLMQGDIRVHSEVGKGTVFAFDVRARFVEADSIDNVPVLPKVVGIDPGQTQYKILIADDTPDSRKLLFKVHEPFGFELREAENGRVAVEIWRKWAPDLIWMDIQMPVMNGYKAAQTIRETEKDNQKPRETIIIAQTASAFEEERATILEAGCDDFLGKPFKETEIFEMLHKHLGIPLVYKEEAQVADRELQNDWKEALMPGTVAALPDSLLESLKKGADQADIILLSGLVEQIREHDERLADAVHRLVEEFEYDEILALIREKTAS